MFRYKIIGTGFMPIFRSGEWLVAANNYCKEINSVESISQLGRHISTDEAFVLLDGNAVLILAGKDNVAGDMRAVRLQHGTIYVVEKGEWHAVIFDENGCCLIIENGHSQDNENLTELFTAAQAEKCRQLAYECLIG